MDIVITFIIGLSVGILSGFYMGFKYWGKRKFDQLWSQWRKRNRILDR